jgi:DNA-binding CsgD family transcriptional regulator
MPENKSNYFKQLRESLVYLPGIFFAKDADFSYQACSLDCAERLNYKDTSPIIGISDYDLPDELQEDAPLFQQQDALVLKGQEIKTLNFHQYQDNQRTIALTTKKPLYLNNEAIGLITNTIELDDTSAKSLLQKGIIDKNCLRCKTKSKTFRISKTCHHDLSVKESICLYHLIRGKSAKEIALKMHLSPKTVEIYTSRIKTKFNAANKSQLIEKAYALNLDSFIPESLLA